MFSGDLGKPYARRYQPGPATAPGVKLAYHGLGTPHLMVYTSNPVSWLVTLQHCIPFLNINSANTMAGSSEAPVDNAVMDQLDISQLGPSGSFFGNAVLNPPPPMPGGVTSPRVDIGTLGQPIPITGFTPAGIPLGTVVAPNPASGQAIGGRTVPLWGSRKTIGIPTIPGVG